MIICTSNFIICNYCYVFSAMSWIKEEWQEDGHRNDHLDIIDNMKKEHSDDNGHRNDHLYITKKEQGDGHGIVNPSKVQFS